MERRQICVLTTVLLIGISLFLATCGEDKPTESRQTTVPVLTTTTVSAVTQTTAESGGNITSDGGATVTARGVCWSMNATPTIADNSTTDGTGTGSFTSSITGLTAGTPYYVRAYATNSVGTGYGNSQSFTTSAAPSTVTDIDGNVYQTVTIGTQVWMAENLKVTHYRNGDVIPYVTDGFAWDALSSGALCEYDLSADTAAIYGLLYNWFAVNDARNIAPEGWHVATRSEWIALNSYLAPNAGGQLKDTGTTYWFSPNEGATNETGFTALPGGERGYQGVFGALHQEAYFWTSTESTTSSRAYVFSLHYTLDYISDRNLSQNSGHSVRCVKD